MPTAIAKTPDIEVLIAESTTQVTFKSARKCRVASGTWDGPFTGRQFSDPSKLDIDHMVPLKMPTFRVAGTGIGPRRDDSRTI